MKTEEWNEIPEHQSQKPYFAKYLHGEGEIKEHSLVFADGRLGVVVYVGTTELGGYEVEFPNERKVLPYLSREVKLAKLFLCSRDIQVDDKLTSISGNEYAIVLEVKENKDMLVVLSNGNKGIIAVDEDEWGEGEVNVHEWFKIIGEISPDATWVKEGDEFDEENLAFLRVDRENGGGWKYCNVEECKGFPTIVEIIKNKLLP